MKKAYPYGVTVVSGADYVDSGDEDDREVARINFSFEEAIRSLKPLHPEYKHY